MKILYTGGGTLGSVSPLIAIHQQIITHYSLHITHYDSLWLGTENGPEHEVVEKAGIKFETIESGKLRRYFDLQNFLDFFRIIIGFFQALYFILKFDPDMILTAGSFVAVPVAWAGFLNNVPVFVHQQDVEVGLANKLMAPIAKKITVALEKSLDDFKKEKVVLVGNPVRENMFLSSRAERSAVEGSIKTDFNFQNTLPVVLILGGGTGALPINELVEQVLPELTKVCNVIHITGKNKISTNYQLPITSYQLPYRHFEFLDEQQICSAMQGADVVVSRAGMAFLTELSYLKKPTIIIPIPNSHQEKNAQYFQTKNAGIYLSQNNLTQENFIEVIKKLLANETQRKEMGENMHQIFIDYSGKKYLDVVLK